MPQMILPSLPICCVISVVSYDVGTTRYLGCLDNMLVFLLAMMEWVLFLHLALPSSFLLHELLLVFLRLARMWDLRTGTQINQYEDTSVAPSFPLVDIVLCRYSEVVGDAGIH